MYLSPSDAQILLALRHGPLDHYEVSADTQQAPFMVRAELKRLKRDRRVRELLDAQGHRWELTGRGQREAEELAGGRLEFEGVR